MAVLQVEERERRRPVGVGEHGGGAAAADGKGGSGGTQGSYGTKCAVGDFQYSDALLAVAVDAT